MLTVVRTITPPDWMSDYKSATIMRVLGGFESAPQALFVGGCVRNTLLGRPVKDIDIATIHTPLEVIEKLKAANIRFVPTGLDHGTLTAIIDDTGFEITTLRKDIDTNGRHAVIAFTTDWAVDAQRRDFTFNTLLASPEGKIFDPTGEGIRDLDARRVVFVGDPASRVAEDYLRILRFFRFHAEYGEGAMDEAALEVCKAFSDKIASLSKERITQEFLKIIASQNSPATLSAMFKQNILKDIGQNYKSAILARLKDFQSKNNVPDIMARLFVISGMKLDFFEQWLVLSNAQKKQLELLEEGYTLLKSVTKKKIREAVYRVGNAVAMQSYFIRLSKNDDLPDLEILDIARYWQAPSFPVSGEDLLRAGVLQGPELGRKLKELEAKWIASDFTKVPKY